jgi:nucleoside-diphosphate-sugar epimerase
MSASSPYAGRAVLVTGGLGMIGSNLAHALVEAGARVTLLDALLPLYGGNPFNVHDVADRLTVEVGDLRDAALVARLVRGQEVIFNLAAQVSYLDSMEDPLLDLDINCRGHLILLEACRRHNPEARVIFTGSRLEYGPARTLPVAEDHPVDPLMIYGIHKFAGERYHLLYHRQYGLGATGLRLTNPYGIRQQMKHSRYGLVNWFIRQAMEGRTITVFGDGAQQRDYVYVADVVDALLAVGATDETIGKVYNVGVGEGTSFRDMVRVVLEVVGRGEMACVPWPPDYLHVDTVDFVPDVTALAMVTGWRPKVGLREGVAATHAYYAAHREHYWR